MCTFLGKTENWETGRLEPEKVTQSAYHIAKRAQGVKIQPGRTQICETFLFWGFPNDNSVTERPTKQTNAMIGQGSDKKGQDGLQNTERPTCVLI